MTDNIITFADFNPKRRKPLERAGTSRMSRVELEQELERPIRDEREFTITGKNGRLRQARNEAWNMARHITNYWRARLDWQFALEFAQDHGLGDSGSFLPASDENRFVLVDAWRDAVAHQLLTPAPNVAAVAWKRAKLAGRGFSQLPVSADRVKHAIDADVEWLEAHPVRQSNRRSAKV
jgi:hypothetical protein